MSELRRSSVLSFSVYANSPAACSASQLRLAVRDTATRPDPSAPSSYNWSRSAVTLSNGLVDLTIALTNAVPLNSLHTGRYYIAVQGALNATCQYTLSPRLSYSTLQARPQAFNAAPAQPLYYSLAAVTANTSTTIAVRLFGQQGVLALHVAANSVPNPADASSYLLSAAHDTAGASGQFAAQPVYLPASTCAPFAATARCTIVVMAVNAHDLAQTFWSQLLSVQAMSSAAAARLLENQTATSSGYADDTAAYQLNLPASPLLVTLSLSIGSALFVWCSYQYVAPDATFHDWQWQLGSNSGTYPAAAQLSFAWANTTTAAAASPLLVNANTQLAAAATTCYCSMQANADKPYSWSYSTAELIPTAPRTSSSSSSSSAAFISSPVPSSASSAPASSSSAQSSSSTASASPPPRRSLSSGALAAAVVVPIVVVLLLLAGMLAWWLRARAVGGGVCCCGEASSKHADGGRVFEGHDSASSERGVSMAEFGQNEQHIRDGSLSSGRWRGG